LATPCVSQIRLTVDTRADLERFRRMVASQQKPWRDVQFSDFLPAAIETRSVA
jgi:spore coat polysaccharide biosynthesis protein SpsF (cytidylyltransferase family)